MRSAIAFVSLSVLLFTVPSMSFADDSTDSYVQRRLDAIRDSDIPTYERDLKTRVGATVSYKVDWKSFKKATGTQAENLGSTLFSITEFAVNAKTPEIAESFKKIKTIDLANDKKAKEASFAKTKKTGVYRLRANFAELKWPEGNGLHSQITAAIQ